MLKGFRDFILRGNVIDLAVAVIIGATFNSVVTSLVKDLISPLIAAFGGQPDFSRFYFTLGNSKFMYGDFLNTLISFLINAAVIYFLIVIPSNRVITKLNKKTETSDKTCPQCLSQVPIKAKRCKYCTSVLK